MRFIFSFKRIFKILIFNSIFYLSFKEAQEANEEADAAEEDEVVELLDQPGWTADDEDDWETLPNENEETWPNERDNGEDDCKQTLSNNFSGFSLDE